MKRRLALRSEYVSELSADELSLVAAGVSPTGFPSVHSPCQTNELLDHRIPSWNAVCPTYKCITATTGG